MLQKELRSFFSSATAIVTIGVFLCATGLFLFVLPGTYNVLDSGYANLDGLFVLAPWLYLFLVPAITMRMFSDEYRLGTMELLLSKPLSLWKIILAKYFAGLLLLFFSMLPVLFYLLPVSLLGSPAFNMDYGAFWGSFLGLFFLAAAYVAIGLFCSCLTQNQVVSFVAAALISFLAYYGFELTASLIGDAAVADKVSKLSMLYHYDSLGRGVIDTSDVVYFMAVALFFLLLCRVKIGPGGKRTLAIGCAAIVAVAVLSANLFLRFDLTAEKRYSLSAPTHKLLEQVEEPINVDLYLSGELNVGFHRLQEAVRDMLREMDAYAGAGVHVKLVNPSKAASTTERNMRYARLQAAGMKPTAVYERDAEGNMQQKLVFPWAAVSIGADTVNVNLLTNVRGLSGDENLNLSIEGLEYAITDALRRLTATEPVKVAFLEGHGEWDEAHVYDFTDALSHYYQVDRGRLSGRAGELDDYKVLIIAAPVLKFTEAEKYVIDQYIMHGGRVLWLLDGALAVEGDMLAPLDVNLADQLFTYGIRINPLLLLDTDCLLVPMNMALAGDAPDFQPVPWYYSPLLAGNGSHVVTKNLSQVRVDYCSPLEFVGADSLAVAVLLSTAGRTGAESLPCALRPDIFALSETSPFFAYTRAPVAAALSGEFRSVFANRLVPEGASNAAATAKRSAPTRMIVVADGDIVRNDVVQENGAERILPLGYDRYSEQVFSNKDFLLNCVNFLADDEGWMELRGRELKLRLLDRPTVAAQRSLWQTLCLAVPLALLAAACAIYNLLRRSRNRL